MIGIRSAQSTTRVETALSTIEPRVLTSMRALFRKIYNVRTATGAAQALDLLEQEHVDVLISDQRMPEITGVELLAQVRTQYPHTMRILLTGYADLEAIEASINEGEVFRYLVKPCPPDDLKRIVELAVTAARADLDPAVPTITDKVVPRPELRLADERDLQALQEKVDRAASLERAAQAEDVPPVQTLPAEFEQEPQDEIVHADTQGLEPEAGLPAPDAASDAAELNPDPGPGPRSAEPEEPPSGHCGAVPR